MSSFFERALLAVHVFSSAAWFGALVYRAFFVDPAAKRFFARGEYERFALQQADGMRWVVLAALVTCGASGFGLLALRWSAAPAGYLALMGVKAGLWAVAQAVFAYISWVFWPRRVFAVEAELPTVHRQGLGLALTMIALAGLGILLGQVARSEPRRGGL